MGDAADRDGEVLREPGFRSFWLAESVSGVGTAVTLLALPGLVLLTLGGSAADLGLVNGARWAPYVVLGLVVGTLVDRRARRPLLVGTDAARAGVLLAVPLLWWAGGLSLATLVGVVLVLGTLSLVNDAATQSFLPRLVDRPRLLAANARLDQSAAVADTAGPALGGALVALLGAPVAFASGAVTYAASAVLTARVRVEEPPPPAVGERRGRLRREVAEGLRFAYRHPMLAPQAVATHGWFLCHAALMTVLAPFVILGLDLGAAGLGLVLALLGAGSLGGSLVALRVGRVLGAGRVVVLAQGTMPVAWTVVALTPPDGTAALVVPAAGMLLLGAAMGLANPHEMGFRQAVTPDHLQARTNATLRAVNRSMVVVGAPLGGVLADALGYRPVLWAGVAGLVLVAVGLALSPFRHATHEEV